MEQKQLEQHFDDIKDKIIEGFDYDNDAIFAGAKVDPEVLKSLMRHIVIDENEEFDSAGIKIVEYIEKLAVADVLHGDMKFIRAIATLATCGVSSVMQNFAAFANVKESA